MIYNGLNTGRTNIPFNKYWATGKIIFLKIPYRDCICSIRYSSKKKNGT